MTTPGVPEHDALLLTGGAARRMGGVDKPGLAVGGRPMVLRVASAVPRARRLVVVGPGYPALRADVLTREEPPGSGPVAAIAAGLPHLRAGAVAVLAADLPFVTGAVTDALLAALAGHDLALLVDDTGRDQYLVAVWRTGALAAALTSLGTLAGAPVRRLVAAAEAAGPVARCRVPVDPAGAPPWLDCDTPDDVRRARLLAAEH